MSDIWGDITNSSWLGPFESGEECNNSHIWFEEGNFEIRVKAKNELGVESSWSDPLSISMPKSKTFDISIPFFEKNIKKYLDIFPAKVIFI